MENFNFRDLGSRNARKLVANRIKQYTEFLRNIYGSKVELECDEVLKKCIDYSNGKIRRVELEKINSNFREEFFIMKDIRKKSLIKLSIDNETKAYLLLRAIMECSNPWFYARISLGLINGYTALSGWYTFEKEKAAQVSAYNRYMRKKRQRTAQIIQAQQPNVLYPNRLISLGE